MRPAEPIARTRLVVATLLFGGALLFGMIDALINPAGPDTLRVEVKTLRSAIAEALALTAADDQGHVTRAFFDVDLELLRRDVERATSHLSPARAQGDLRARFEEIARLAEVSRVGLDALATPGSPPDSVVAAQASLAAAKVRLSEIEREIAR